MIDRVKPQTEAAWDITTAGKDRAGAIFTKIFELSNVMKAKGASGDTFQVYLTDRIFFEIRSKLTPTAEGDGEISSNETRWVIHRDKTKENTQKVLIRGSGYAAVMRIANL